MQRIGLALAIPLGVALFIALWMAGFRVLLLSFSKEVAPIVALLIALVILGGATVIAQGDEPARGAGAGGH